MMVRHRNDGAVSRCCQAAQRARWFGDGCGAHRRRGGNLSPSLEWPIGLMWILSWLRRTFNDIRLNAIEFSRNSFVSRNRIEWPFPFDEALKREWVGNPAAGNFQADRDRADARKPQ